ncbi:MAG: DUF2149 domain-containing protein [archaeon]|uniref:DUF2149 domain-containing protein n=1 Tax=Methanobrevibacter gottschalkii DSM 11977 TaxID=1122229 RepID=A0A3N5BTS8_9EURY|nr:MULTISPECIES: DUF2149 domain-containing protein [Methanobrevibacter]MCQ2970796.1 DUF2149 domain-containing protein [archaeon]OED01778.1 hypothetical protein A9505_00040 [Methanobrevibacter sp. A27]RPF50892.1 hypothetical protein EDC42_1551 [Methanobrevibacter gottschalkii DSM 11977]
MARRKCKKRFSDNEEDPMTGTSNLVDAMLVIAVGFLIFVVISWNMQSIVFSDTSHDQSQSVQDSHMNVTEVSEGQELNDTLDSVESSGQGYMEMGKVYKDPSTGKLIMVEG